MSLSEWITVGHPTPAKGRKKRSLRPSAVKTRVTRRLRATARRTRRRALRQWQSFSGTGTVATARRRSGGGATVRQHTRNGRVVQAHTRQIRS